jgi:hypothetical protein
MARGSLKAHSWTSTYRTTAERNNKKSVSTTPKELQFTSLPKLFRTYIVDKARGVFAEGIPPYTLLSTMHLLYLLDLQIRQGHEALTQYALSQYTLVTIKDVIGKVATGKIYNTSKQFNIPGHIFMRRLFLKRAHT